MLHELTTSLSTILNKQGLLLYLLVNDDWWFMRLYYIHCALLTLDS